MADLKDEPRDVCCFYHIDLVYYDVTNLYRLLVTSQVFQYYVCYFSVVITTPSVLIYNLLLF